MVPEAGALYSGNPREEDQMKISPAVILLMLGSANVATARMVVREVTPSNTRWRVETRVAAGMTSFTFFIPFKDARLPDGAAATLEVFDGKKPVSSSTLQLQSEGKKTFFRFAVANQLLEFSRFTLTKIDVPHPAGDMYWANLKKFARGVKGRRKPLK